MKAEHDVQLAPTRRQRSERFLAALEPFTDVVLISHINPDPDALASMLGLKALINRRQAGKAVTLTLDGMLARAENQAMAELLAIPLVPIAGAVIGPTTGVVMVDAQPRTGQRPIETTIPHVVIDHHETPGELEGVLFRDLRPKLGATSTIVTGYLLEQDVAVSERLATALLYGIESEITGYPRESGPADDGALVWLYPRADKDLLARIRNPKLPQSYFATYYHALTNAFLYQGVLVSWCGAVPQPDIIAELADFFIRFDQVDWALSLGLFENLLKVSVRANHIGGHCGELLRAVVDGYGTAGGHDRRAGGAIPLTDTSPDALRDLLGVLRGRFLSNLQIDEHHGRRLFDACPMIQIP